MQPAATTIRPRARLGSRRSFPRYRDLGFTAFKMKIGGASLAEDLARIEAALEIAGNGRNLAVDANGRFDLETGIFLRSCDLTARASLV